MRYTPTVLVGPSGVGKGTLLHRVCANYPEVWLSVSATTRQPRPGEVHGEHYFFFSEEEFDDLVSSNGFLEWARYQSSRYGTPRAQVVQQIHAGRVVIMEVEVQGALQIMEKLSPLRTIFIAPPSLVVLESRLRSRGTESEEVIISRLETAKKEMEFMDHCDHVIINDELAKSTGELVNLLGLSATSRDEER